MTSPTPKKQLQKTKTQLEVRVKERQKFTKEPIPVEVSRELRSLAEQISKTPV